MKGKFIVFEGVDGSGKTTQIKLLGEKLESMGCPVVYTREPGGTRVGERIREILLNPLYGELVPWAEALLYAAARAQHVAQVILPALREGKVVLCDRFTDSSLAYQGYGRGVDIEMLEQVNRPAAAGVVPDLVLVLDFDREGQTERMARSGRSADRIEREAQEFYRRVRSGYLALAARAPRRYRVIDASRAEKLVHLDVLKAAEEVLDAFLKGNSRA
ncbi:thymidylate kinase [Pelotomaculum thermopropionicum SI]|uniref:Thymidylate kinase n=1 Tax=Pelotomaculum thermopropionicum (strain DSM 13744 / JCM 10971 / SI) TaxID=370438 RepID=KTHY_PELTS|nr:RecName: Full=Thymidylate kinase; AltName: Full=dTMP kinase [Pelotomaculum thermopropionicum SI]BAF58243.1 thymidylate kinase [Pelotomaculum thermopropionicum SI]